VADAARLYAREVLRVTGRFGGHRFDLFGWPAVQAAADPEAIRTDGG
jgi:hypothetical protein